VQDKELEVKYTNRTIRNETFVFLSLYFITTILSLVLEETVHKKEIWKTARSISSRFRPRGEMTLRPVDFPAYSNQLDIAWFF